MDFIGMLSVKLVSPEAGQMPLQRRIVLKLSVVSVVLPAMWWSRVVSSVAAPACVLPGPGHRLLPGPGHSEPVPSHGRPARRDKNAVSRAGIRRRPEPRPAFGKRGSAACEGHPQCRRKLVPRRRAAAAGAQLTTRLS